VSSPADNEDKAHMIGSRHGPEKHQIVTWWRLCCMFGDYFWVTIFWLPKTRTLGPANSWRANSNDTSKFTQRYLINFNTFKVDYASSVWIENCYIVIWKQDMSWENRTVGQPCATQLKTKHDNMKAHGQTRDG